jgi:colanic acid biosynthesis glycosyl transferase WcaI
MKRLVVLTQYFAPEVGAAQTRLSAVVAELVRRGVNVDVVTAMPNYPQGRIHEGYRRKLYTKEHRAGATVRRVWVYAAQGAGAKRLVNYASFAAACTVGLAATRKPTHVFIESPPLTTAVAGLLYARMRRATAILNVADLWPDAAIEVGALNSRPEGCLRTRTLVLPARRHHQLCHRRRPRAPPR